LQIAVAVVPWSFLALFAPSRRHFSLRIAHSSGWLETFHILELVQVAIKGGDGDVFFGPAGGKKGIRKSHIGSAQTFQGGKRSWRYGVRSQHSTFEFLFDSNVECLDVTPLAHYRWLIPWGRDAARPYLGDRVALAPLVGGPALAQVFASMYVEDMTQAVAQILGEVEQLSERERQQLRHAIVENIPMAEDLTDEDFAALAAASFRALDEEENQRHA